jgi:hypothetical protein
MYMATEKSVLLGVYLQEYDKLKAEQTQRIGFRDNLLYVTLGVFGAVLSFALDKSDRAHALLVLPWICLVLGWTYLVNDEKISALGRYIRLELVPRVGQELQVSDAEALSILGWEIAHRSDNRRKRRKIEQLIIDEITFVASGIAGLVAFWMLVHPSGWAIQSLCLVELALLLVLAAEILIYADLAKGK